MNKLIYNTFEKLFSGYFVWTAMSIAPIAISRDKLISMLDNFLTGLINFSYILFEKLLILGINIVDLVYVKVIIHVIEFVNKII